MKRLWQIWEAGFYFMDRYVLGIAKTTIVQIDGLEKYSKETDELLE